MTLKVRFWSILKIRSFLLSMLILICILSLRNLTTHITIIFHRPRFDNIFLYRFQKGRLVLTFVAMWSLSVRTKPLFVANRMGVALPWAQFHIRLLVWSEIRSWLTPFLWLVSTFLCTGYFTIYLLSSNILVIKILLICTYLV